MQLAFFVQRRKALRKTPKCIRGITVVKVGGDLSHSRLKGAISPDEFLALQFQNRKDDSGTFLEIDPREGFSVRNFQIQACKMARLSDIVIYADGETDEIETLRLARRISKAQRALKDQSRDSEAPLFSTFVVTGKRVVYIELLNRDHANSCR